MNAYEVLLLSFLSSLACFLNSEVHHFGETDDWMLQ